MACSKTISRRNKYIKSQIEATSGSNKEDILIQTSKLVKSFDEEARVTILRNANISPVEIDAETMVAMKVDMGIPWEKLKTMSRFVKHL